MGRGAALSVGGLDVWQWLALFQHELLVFAAVFFLIGAIDDLAVDLLWLWLRITGRVSTPRADRQALGSRELHGPAAVFIPAWNETAVIGDTVAHLLGSWPQGALRLYIGCYRNDPATLAAAMTAARGDPRLRLVIHDRDGPSTKADCLNRLFAAMLADERRSGRRFAMTVFHDAEDMVDPAALGLLDDTIATGADFAQLPVEPLPVRRGGWLSCALGSHYCEEFAEAHGKGMVVRDALGVGLPGAGVGCALSRRALDWLCVPEGTSLPFPPDSLTEDYELGLTVSALGGTSKFVRMRGTDGRLIATRAFFPARFDSVVRQKSRWVHGIALQGWDRVGWSGGLRERWMRARDRRGPLTALVLMVGYGLVVLTGIGGIAVMLGLTQPVPLSPMLEVLLFLNLAALLWRGAARFAFAARNYGVAEGLRALARLPLANVIAIIAGRRAVTAYVRTLLGHGVRWDKTEHFVHPTRLGLAEAGVR